MFGSLDHHLSLLQDSGERRGLLGRHRFIFHGICRAKSLEKCLTRFGSVKDKKQRLSLVDAFKKNIACVTIG